MRPLISVKRELLTLPAERVYCDYREDCGQLFPGKYSCLVLQGGIMNNMEGTVAGSAEKAIQKKEKGDELTYVCEDFYRWFRERQS